MVLQPKRVASLGHADAPTMPEAVALMDRRSLYASMIPPGMEAAFFALYAVTDKGSSALGPMVVGRIVDSTGDIRSGFWFLALLVLLPLPVLYCVDLAKGRGDAARFVEERERRRVE